MITDQQLKTISNNYLEARKSLHPAKVYDYSTSKNALIELLGLVGYSEVNLTEHANGDLFVSFPELADKPSVCDKLLPVFEGIRWRTGGIEYGYNTTFYGHFTPWFYVPWQSLHEQILSWGE
jgi:hypothetical protein